MRVGFSVIVRSMVWVLIGCSGWTIAQAQDASDWPRAERIGAQLYELDRVARSAHEAGEDLRAFRRDEKILGWVFERSVGDYRITFVGEARDGTPIALYQVQVDASGNVLDKMRKLDKSPLSSRLAAQYEAGKNAALVDYESCSAEYQTLALQDAGGSQQGWQTYLLPRSSYADVIIFGGSYLVDMTASGAQARTVTALAAEGCSVLSNPAGAAALQQDGAPDTGPNELHVFLSLQAGKPLYVVSEDHTWLIQDGRIRLMPTGVPEA